jgi:hypothetical protein
MPGRKRPTPEDAVTARRILLDGLARDADVWELVSELAPLHPRGDTFPGEVCLRLAADALDCCGPAGLVNAAITSMCELGEKALLRACGRGCATPSLKVMRRGRLPAWASRASGSWAGWGSPGAVDRAREAQLFSWRCLERA